jgi:threonine dehydrogenase-like Zn-dependent dehydrogenase
VQPADARERPKPPSEHRHAPHRGFALAVLSQGLRPGELPFYNAPPHPFTPGTNALGTIEAVGPGVWHLKPGQRVVFSSHFVAGENVDDPARS